MEIVDILKPILVTVAAYLLGSIPFGLVFTRCFGTVDIRRTGSGNIGATNVLRTSGKPLAAATLAADILKGALPVWYALFVASSSDISAERFVSGVALAAFAGHLFPLYSGFRHGGKGVATTLGALLIISPLSAAVALSVFILLVRATRRVSVGSLGAAALMPLIMALVTGSPDYTAFSAITATAIWWRHRGNIGRLIQGEEPSLGKKR